MRFHLDQNVKNTDGGNLLEGAKEVTIRDVLAFVALQLDAQEQLPLQQKLTRYDLYNHLQKRPDDVYELKIEEVAMLKELVGKFCTIFVCGQIIKFLESAAIPDVQIVQDQVA